MISNQVVCGIVFPDRAHTDVRNEGSWLYPLDASTGTNACHAIDTHVYNAHEGGNTDDKMEGRERFSPSHLSLYYVPPLHHICMHQTILQVLLTDIRAVRSMRLTLCNTKLLTSAIRCRHATTIKASVINISTC